MAEKQRITGIYAAYHFLVDFGCAFFVFSAVAKTRYFYLAFLVYNFCAFALQLPVGLLADRWNRNSLMAAGGCVLVGLAALLPFSFGEGWLSLPFAGLFGAALAGVGNCLFHVGGGIEVMNISEEKLTPLGIFVSPGALGIFLGRLLGKKESLPLWLLCLLLLTGAGLLLIFQYRQKGNFRSENVSLTGTWQYPPGRILWLLLLLFLVVVLRSHLGMTFSFPWKQSSTGGVLALLALLAGKAAGGMLADRIGIRQTVCLSLGAATLCFLFADRMLPGVAGTFLFNMSMPITLYLAAELLHRCRGFAFGLLTFAIYLGFLPAYFGKRSGSPAGFAGMAAVSFMLLLISLKGRKEAKN